MSQFSSRSIGVVITTLTFSFFVNSALAEVPTMALRAVAVNGSPIAPTENVSVSAGDTVSVEIHVWGWGVELPDGVDKFSARVLNRRGVVSGRNGTVLPLGWDAPLDPIFCNPNEGGFCPSDWTCLGAGEFGACRGMDHFPGIGARVDANRSDYLFFGFDTIGGTGTALLDYDYFGLTTDSQLRLDDGGIWYVGSLTLVVSEAACGTFTFYLGRCSESTLLGSRSAADVEPLLLPLEIDAGVCPLLPTSTFPENCAVDARRAFGADALGEELGWDRVSFQFDRNPAGTSSSDFVVSVVPVSEAPEIVDIEQVGAVTLILTFDRSISPEHWTCITHLPSSRVVCVGSLPVDVDQSLLSGLVDVEALFASLGPGDTTPEYQCDLDRSLRCRPTDILEAIDLLNGASSSPWKDSAIEMTCPSDSSAIFRDPSPEDRGACCNITFGACTDDVPFDECSAVGGLWSSATPCCAAACVASSGSCCNESTGSCVDNVAAADCRGGGETWAANSSCDAVECGLPRGACCNLPLGRCRDNALESRCQRAGEVWSDGLTCGDILCNPG